MKKIFTNDRFFAATAWVAVLGTLVSSALNLVFYPALLSTVVTNCISALCVLFLYTNYKKHSKNVMKGLLGALLMQILLRGISSLSVNTTGTGFEVVTSVLYALSAVVLFINHFIINSDHHSKPAHIRLNQIACVVLFLCECVFNVAYIAQEPVALIKISVIIHTLAFAGIAASVVCVESRLDAYRIEREANGYKAE